MKIRTPYTRHDLQISKKDNVVEVGSGHNPFYRANVIVEKFIDNNSLMPMVRIFLLKIKNSITLYVIKFLSIQKIRCSL